MLRIDAHHHTWDQTVREQDWMTPELDAIIGGPYTLADWRTVARPANVRYGMFVQTVNEPGETPEMLAEADGHPWLAGVVGWVDVDDESTSPGQLFDALLEGTGGARLAGVRLTAERYADANWLDTPRVHLAAEAARRRNLTLDLLTQPVNLPAAQRLAASAPETRLVLNHLSKPSMLPADFAAWEADIRSLAARENVACKFSGYLTFDGSPMTAARLAPYFEVVLDAFGADRLMWGSDWPVNELGGGFARSVAIAEELLAECGTSEQRSIWAGTALQWYPALAHTNSNIDGGALLPEAQD